MKAISFPQKVYFRLFLPDVCQLRSRQHRRYVHVTEHEFLSPNCSKIAVECDWDSKNSQNVQNLGFSTEKLMGFLRKNLIFFQNRLRWQICCRIRIKWYCFVKMSFPPYLWSFLGIIRKFWKLEKLEKMMKKVFFFERKKTFSSSKKPFLQKWEAAKNACGSRPSC